MSAHVVEAADVIGVQASAGWRIVTREAEAALKELQDKSWAAEGDEAVLAAHREAAGALKFWNILQTRLTNVTQYTEYKPDNAFTEVSMM